MTTSTRSSGGSRRAKPSPAKPRRRPPAKPKAPLPPAEAYIRDVLDGTRPACKWERLAVERHVCDLKHGHKRGLRFDAAAAQHALDFFKFLRHSKGEWGGKEFELQPWQAFIVWCLFGWLKADGKRRFNVAYIEVPRKNGKSTLLAGIGLYLLLADREHGAEIYTAATTKAQARIIHRDALNMVKRSAALKTRIRIYRDNLSIERTASKFEPLGGDSKTLDGLNVHGALLDELHAHKSGELFDILDTATGARQQALVLCITTAGSDDTSFCFIMRRDVLQVLDPKSGQVDDTLFGIVYTIDEGDDWKDEASWAKANPNFGLTVKPDDLRRKAKKAERLATQRNAFLRLHLDVWTKAIICWLPPEDWDRCAAPVNLESLLREECCAGLDLANTRDLASLVLVFELELEDGPTYVAVPYFWAPAERLIERERLNLTRLEPWVQEGLIEICPGNVIDYGLIRRRLNGLREQGVRIREIAFDPFNAAQLSNELQEDGFKVFSFQQSMANFNEPAKKLEELVASQRLRHGGNGVLRWMAGNVTIVTNGAGNYMPHRKKSRDKIDGVVALLMGLGRNLLRSREKPSVYETQGISRL